ncbi:(2Fe-2S)-binding protein [Celeribacter indicus]|uniref:(2Fe-2S)-binding domain-containing protein n=1 Tax=Celeribacter indicus TaxID=1208324 RepID=A0A0B5DX93_9RHOB|nr:(2Fe-2S)-binding protein [Celeribacter indicus]AJE44882.1 (2Fe-2S)-binding domain-containing protein [Celeribacter indicus]SDX22864.1 purine hydroxylase delta subunit apoprotein [Celeribacter indicus]
MSHSDTRTISFTLNGKPVSAEIEIHWTLVDLLQRGFDLYGARQSCGQGLCGCCTVVMNGKPVSGCLSLAALADGGTIETIENGEEQLDPVQEAFIEAGAFQCGFCTPGFILMTRQLIADNPEPSEDDIRHYLTGNLCRCGTYPQIVEAVRMAAARHRAARMPA